jgi:diamine N-acetyltransferase
MRRPGGARQTVGTEGGGVNVRLVTITKDNWEEAASLTVAPEQADFLTPNVWSIAESKFYPALTPMAIHDGPRMVGFLMYAVDPEDDQYWLYRFMIAAPEQGKGYGKAALRLLLDLLRQERKAPWLNVGYHRENRVAERLYLRAGFEKTGVAPWGELTARIRL